jgi:hypothetical protein
VPGENSFAKEFSPGPLFRKLLNGCVATALHPQVSLSAHEHSHYELEKAEDNKLVETMSKETSPGWQRDRPIRLIRLASISRNSLPCLTKLCLGRI